MVKRQRPRWRELAPLLKRPPKSGARLERSLDRLANIEDLRRRGRRRTPRAAFDYVDGAADDELSLSRSRRLFQDLEFAPNILRDVSVCDPSTSILGRRSAFPFAFAPTGFTRMMHHEGEAAVASVASDFGIPYVLSTMGTTSPEGVAAAAPDGERWFQLYVWKDRAVSEALIERVKASGFSTLVLTVDLPVGGARLRDVRNGMTIPPNLTLKAVLDGATHPRWWINFLTTEPLTFASLVSTDGTVVDTTDKFFDASLNFEDLSWLRDHWEGPIVVKGVQSVDDVKRCVAVGAAGVVLSNHGGRQLDRSPLPLRLIQPSVDAVGNDAEIYVDGGIMNGGDIVAAVALGANAALVGRAYLYGLMAGGEAGVRRAAQILSEDIVRTMKLLGVQSVEELTPSHVRLPRATT
ncbi:MAG: alpha-hydroxy acid oxidase [Actinomycetota bacterium]|nr:alpha-hydroxy acid oxidase [Actinomycetota bacterium]